ncbi:hypothetical protein L1D44_05435 [Shewanella sp. Isolate13]|uniref:hypothetical protein n=1 Tax=Shewanella sp. Isolate13 TaxID=2908531 RepID=UPI001EFDC8E0|nr:hypothetical protein [Shewanella sp. Isolate13]MCG9729287.1 hypothetical protein [Shewanella sp. Isolate13]
MANGELKQRLNWQRGGMSTLSLLLMFLLSVTTFVFGSLYFEQVHKVKSLSAEVKQLKQSQVLLMVPDDQAEVMANWMANNPHFVQSFVDKAKQGESTVLPIGPGIEQKPLNQELRTKANGLMTPGSGQAQEHKQESETPNKLIATHVNSASSEELPPNSTAKQELIAPSKNNKVTSTATPEQEKTTSKVDLNMSNRHPQKQITLTETAEGVKLISLPHGGIRVTTREPDN